MRIKDFVVEKISAWGLDYSEKLLLAEMQRLGLSQDSDYTDDSAEDVDMLFYNIIPDLLMMPSSVSEGGYSVSYNKNAIANYYKALCRKLGKADQLAEQNNSIKDITKQW